MLGPSIQGGVVEGTAFLFQVSPAVEPDGDRGADAEPCRLRRLIEAQEDGAPRANSLGEDLRGCSCFKRMRGRRQAEPDYR